MLTHRDALRALLVRMPLHRAPDGFGTAQAVLGGIERPLTLSVELLRNVVVLAHIVGFAVIFGTWVVEATARRFRTTRLMGYGLLISLITGLALAAPWPAGIHLNCPKIGIKPAIRVVLGSCSGWVTPGSAARVRRCRVRCFVSVGVLALSAAGIAVIW
jgi:hypothetical protein